MVRPVKRKKGDPMDATQLGNRIIELLGLKEGEWFRLSLTRDGHVLIGKKDTVEPAATDA